MRYLIALLLIVSLQGCGASLSIIRNEDGSIKKVIAQGMQKTLIKKGDEEISMETKQKIFPDFPPVVLK